MAQKKLTKDRGNRDAAEYLLGLETLAEYFRITNFVSSLPSRAYKNEVEDWAWIKVLRDKALSCGDQPSLFGWRKRKLVRFFFAERDLNEKQRMQLVLADDLVLLYSVMRHVKLLELNREECMRALEYEIGTLRARVRPVPRFFKSSEVFFEKIAQIEAVHTDLMQLYHMAWVDLEETAGRVQNLITDDAEKMDEIRQILLFPEEESILTQFVDLRMRLSPERILIENSLPQQIYGAVRVLESGTEKLEPMQTLESKFATLAFGLQRDLLSSSFYDGTAAAIVRQMQDR